MILPNPRNSILRVLSIFDYYPKMRFFPKNLTLSILSLRSFQRYVEFQKNPMSRFGENVFTY